MTASYGDNPERSCYGKRAYKRSQDAKRAAKRRNATVGGRPIKPYHCMHCGAWHNGHDRRRKDAA